MAENRGEKLGVMLCGHGSRDTDAVAEFAVLAAHLKKRLPQYPVEFGYLEFATPIIREGDEGRGLFLLLSGEVEVSRDDHGHRVVLAMLKSGDLFGEISLIEQTKTTATVTALRNSTVLFLGKELFDRLVQGVPELHIYFENLAQERVMDTNLTLSAARDASEELLDDDLILL